MKAQSKKILRRKPPRLISKKMMMRMAISCILVALLPLIVCNVLNEKISKASIEGKQKEAGKALLTLRNQYDAELLNLETVVALVLNEDELQRVGAAENPLKQKNNIFLFKEAQQRVNRLMRGFDLIGSLVLYNIPQQFAISDDTVFLKPDLLPGNMESQYVYYQWPQELLPSLSTDVHVRRQWAYMTHEDNQKAVAIYINTTYLKHKDNVILEIISPENLQKFLYIDKDTQVLLFNEAGQCLNGQNSLLFDWEQLSSMGETARLTGHDGVEYYVIASKSEMAGHMLFSATPMSIIEADALLLRTSNLVYFCAILLFTLLLSGCIAVINMRPLDEILLTLFDKDALYVARKIDWATIDERIHAVVNENAQMADAIKLQQEQMKTNLIYDLINHSENQTQQIMQRIERLNIPLHDHYYLLIFEFVLGSDNRDAAAFSLLIRKAVEYHIEDVFNISEMTARRYCVIVRDHGQQQSETERQFRNLLSELENSFSRPVQGCVSYIQNLEDVKTKYWEMIIAIESNETDENGLISMEQSPKGMQELMFPQHLEQKIVAAIITGSREQLDAVLDELYQLNSPQVGASVLKNRLLTERVNAVIAIALMRSKDVPELLQFQILRVLHNLPEAETCGQFKHHIMSSVDAAMLLTKKDKSVSLHRSELGRKVVEYIQQHLTEPDLCLQSLVDHFQLSTSYIHILIKNETGTSFTDYCEKLRMANACDLLRQGKQIQAVAEEVGYVSPHTFRRVFKKVVGVLPSQYGQN